MMRLTDGSEHEHDCRHALHKDNAEKLEALSKVYGVGTFAAINIAVSDAFDGKALNMPSQPDQVVEWASNITGYADTLHGLQPGSLWRLEALARAYGFLHIEDALNVAVSDAYDHKVAAYRDASGD